jgi:predicted RNA-binding Zn-ribbon protein involved in translation (DUF1610 family)
MAEQKIQRKCTHCEAMLNVPVSAIGKKGKCPSCGNTFLLTQEQIQPFEPIIELESQPLIDLDRSPSPVRHSNRMSRCRTCQKQVSKRAKACPNCGEKNPSFSGFRAGCNGCLTIIIASSFILWALSGFPGCEIRGVITRF